ncbi:NAD/NADP octopine/nopaline dehydrogenase family protein [Clostridiaceae bacterium HSG29]|nr:NAD/NADP octopine/nopaline dehydrogenase family protein [Clostridiaceae bacterium HSG29]
MKKLKWAVIGGGNGGQSSAGHIALLGHEVRLYDISEKTVEILNEKGGINLTGEVEGFGKLKLATTDIKEAVDGVDIIMIVAPALAHRAIAKSILPYVEDGQIIFVHPGATGGALEFMSILKKERPEVSVIIAEAMSLIYACRVSEVGEAQIFGIKEKLMVAALPANKTQEVLDKINLVYPTMYAGKNVLQTSLENLNSIMHPGPTLLNTSMIESGREWKYYWDGITPSIGKFAVGIDKERVEIGKKLGIELLDVKTWYNVLYNSKGETLSEIVKDTNAYSGISGQKEIRTRYILEDIPMGLIPMVELAKVLGIKTKRMETVISLGEILLDTDLYENARTIDRLGLEGMNREQILDYVQKGVK